MPRQQSRVGLVLHIHTHTEECCIFLSEGCEFQGTHYQLPATLEGGTVTRETVKMFPVFCHRLGQEAKFILTKMSLDFQSCPQNGKILHLLSDPRQQKQGGEKCSRVL